MTHRFKDRMAEFIAVIAASVVLGGGAGYLGVLRGQAVAESRMAEQDRRLERLERDYGELSKAFTEGTARLRDEVSALRADTSYIRGKLEGK